MLFYDLLAGIPPYGWGFRLCGKPFCPIAAPAARKAGSRLFILSLYYHLCEMFHHHIYGSGFTVHGSWFMVHSEQFPFLYKTLFTSNICILPLTIKHNCCSSILFAIILSLISLQLRLRVKGGGCNYSISRTISLSISSRCSPIWNSNRLKRFKTDCIRIEALKYFTTSLVSLSLK